MPAEGATAFPHTSGCLCWNYQYVSKAERVTLVAFSQQQKMKYLLELRIQLRTVII